jgi:hypothetical protein
MILRNNDAYYTLRFQSYANKFSATVLEKLRKHICSNDYKLKLRTYITLLKRGVIELRVYMLFRSPTSLERRIAHGD